MQVGNIVIGIDYERKGLSNNYFVQLTLNNYEIAVDIASIPDQIRGFGHVKLNNIKIAKKSEHSLMSTFNETI